MKATVLHKKHLLRRACCMLLICGLGIAASPACAQQYGTGINPNSNTPQPLTTASPNNPSCANGQAGCTPNGTSTYNTPSGYAPSAGNTGSYNAPSGYAPTNGGSGSYVNPSGYAPTQGNTLNTPNSAAPGVSPGMSGNAPLGGAATGAAKR